MIESLIVRALNCLFSDLVRVFTHWLCVRCFPSPAVGFLIIEMRTYVIFSYPLQNYRQVAMMFSQNTSWDTHSPSSGVYIQVLLSALQFQHPDKAYYGSKQLLLDLGPWIAQLCFRLLVSGLVGGRSLLAALSFSNIYKKKYVLK